MTNSFINSFITYKQQLQFPNQAVIHPVQIKSTGIKPYAPVGHLVEENALQGVGSSFKDAVSSAKYFYDAVNGKGNDYTVGQINDLTTKLGSLGIAGILSAGLSTRLGKGMEFVGFACWFAAMSIWPKVFVGGPIKALTGVDLSKQYVDSQGRKKYFYQDPQYICWDLMDKQKIEKMGDKLGIPKNIDNRQDAIKDKVKQIAIQGNTLTMLTAGFSTPILASLIADQLKVPFGDLVDKVAAGKAENKLAKIAKNLPKNIKDIKSEVTGNNLKIANNITVTPETVQVIEKTFAERFESLSIYNSVKGELADVLAKQKSVIVIDDAFKANIKEITGLSEKSIDAFVQSIGKQQLASLTEKQDFAGKLVGHLENELVEQAKTPREKLRIQSSLNKTIKAVTSKLDAFYEASGSVKLEEPEKIIKLYKIADDFVAKKDELTKYLVSTLENVEGSITGRTWESSSTQIAKAFGLKGKELKALAKGKLSSEQAEEIMSQAIDNIVNDKSKLEKTVQKLARVAKKASDKDKKLAEPAFNYIKQLSESYSKIAQEEGFEKLSKDIGRTCDVARNSIINKLIDTKTSFFRPIKVLDIFARKGEIKDFATLKRILFERSASGNFFTKLEEYQKHRQNSFNEIMDNIFAPIGDAVKKAAGDFKDVITDVNGNNKMLKGLFGKINNEVLPGINVENADNLLKGSLVEQSNNVEGYVKGLVNHSTEFAGKGFKDLMRMGTENLAIYNTWFKRVGIAGLAVLGVTTAGLAMVGKKNKFNQDRYEFLGGNANVR